MQQKMHQSNMVWAPGHIVDNGTLDAAMIQTPNGMGLSAKALNEIQNNFMNGQNNQNTANQKNNQNNPNQDNNNTAAPSSSTGDQTGTNLSTNTPVVNANANNNSATTPGGNQNSLNNNSNSSFNALFGVATPGSGAITMAPFVPIDDNNPNKIIPGPPKKDGDQTGTNSVVNNDGVTPMNSTVNDGSNTGMSITNLNSMNSLGFSSTNSNGSQMRFGQNADSNLNGITVQFDPNTGNGQNNSLQKGQNNPQGQNNNQKNKNHKPLQAAPSPLLQLQKPIFTLENEPVHIMVQVPLYVRGFAGSAEDGKDMINAVLQLLLAIPPFVRLMTLAKMQEDYKFASEFLCALGFFDVDCAGWSGGSMEVLDTEKVLPQLVDSWKVNDSTTKSTADESAKDEGEKDEEKKAEDGEKGKDAEQIGDEKSSSALSLKSSNPAEFLQHVMTLLAGDFDKMYESSKIKPMEAIFKGAYGDKSAFLVMDLPVVHDATKFSIAVDELIKSKGTLSDLPAVLMLHLDRESEKEEASKTKVAFPERLSVTMKDAMFGMDKKVSYNLVSLVGKQGAVNSSGENSQNLSTMISTNPGYYSCVNHMGTWHRIQNMDIVQNIPCGTEVLGKRDEALLLCYMKNRL